MDFIQEIIRSFGEITGSSEIEIAFYLVFAAIFIWIYRELKSTYDQENERKEKGIEACILALSPIISTGHIYINTTENKKIYSIKFFELVYASYPYIDYKLLNQLEQMLNNYELSDEKKIDEIINLVKKAIIEMSYKKRKLLRSDLLIEDLEQYFMKFVNIIIPIIQSLAFFLLISFLFLIGTTGVNQAWMVIKPTAFLVMFMQLVMAVDLMRLKKLPFWSVLCICGSTLSVFFIIITEGWLSILLILLWLALLVTSLNLKRKF